MQKAALSGGFFAWRVPVRTIGATNRDEPETGVAANATPISRAGDQDQGVAVLSSSGVMRRTVTRRLIREAPSVASFKTCLP